MIRRDPAFVLVPVATLLTAGCFNPKFKDHIACDLNRACPSGLVCSAQNTCDPMESMAPPLDSGANPPIDARPNAPGCFGTDPFMICLAALPTAPLSISLPTTIDTTNSPMCVATTSSGSAGYCVVAATTIAITQRLRGIGSKPLVLLATDSITVSGSNGWIDVGNHRGDADLGAGADPAACLAGTGPDDSSGGAGGSFTGTGGSGGSLAGFEGLGGQAAPGSTNITGLQGGCAGQGGVGGASGGRGGGAVYLLASTKIEITADISPHTGINAAGESGSHGVSPSGAAVVHGGGAGGGSGGMILFDAPTITCTGLILASGGGGGEGNAATSQGNSGEDPTGVDPAAGGSGNPGGGNGGAGSSAVAAGNGTSGSNGQFDDVGDKGAGGGGGGGAGLIKAPAGANLGTQVSPPATS